MKEQYSQELIDEIKDTVSNRMDELKAMSREDLSAEYLKVVGVEAHPRMHLDLMAKMIARFFQGELWHEKTGDIPTQIRKKDMEFWLSMEAYFVPKSALKEEQAQPITSQAKRKKKAQVGPQGLPGSRGTGLQSKAKNIEDAIVFLVQSPTASMLENYKDHDVQDNEETTAMLILDTKGKDRRSLPFPQFAAECKKKKLKKPAHMLALVLKRKEYVELVYPNEPEPEPIQEAPEEKEGVTFSEVLVGVETKGQKLIVEPDCVDFGTDEKVSDYD